MRAIAWSIAASAALVAGYLALGGASYAPAKVADPCAQRHLREASGFQEVAQRIVLSALDGAACELGVSREEVVLAFSSRESLERFAREHRIGTDRLEELVRSGLLRGVDDAEQEGSLEPRIADLLRAIIRRVPLSEVLDLLDLLPGV
jgi:uncharacterized protein YheU (UPF0270 family)